MPAPRPREASHEETAIASGEKSRSPFRFADLRLDRKVALLGAINSVATAFVLVLLAASLSRQYNELARAEVDILISADLDHITTGIYDLVRAEDEAVRELIGAQLVSARRLVAEAGGAGLSDETVEWEAVDQSTGGVRKVRLPKMSVGGTWLGRNSEAGTPTPYVDDMAASSMANATIFQLMDMGGDMLRVATNVRDSAGKRAIGTYIPARFPDGSPNPIVEAVLGGETFHGRAFVVNAWYLTAYEPLRDAAKRIIGMLYVGVKQESAEARIRQAILGIEIGDSGYAWVVTGTGENRGRYVISQRGERDGEYIWEVQDEEGSYIVQEIIDEAVSLRPRELGDYRYRWQNPGEPEPRWKVSRLAYYEPWDWVIGAGAYEDELQAYRSVLDSGRASLTWTMILSSVIISALMVFAGSAMSRTITRPLRRMTEAAEEVMRGELPRDLALTSGGEIGRLASAFSAMVERIDASMAGLRESEEKYRNIYENAIEGMFRTSFEGRVLGANPSMARILGYASAEEAMGLLTDIGKQLYVREQDRFAFLAALREKGVVEGWEVLLKRKDGGEIWVAISARVVADPRGHSPFLEGFIVDIGERKRAAEELRQGRERLEELVAARTIGMRTAMEAAEEASRAKSGFLANVSHELRTPLNGILGYAQILGRRGGLDPTQEYAVRTIEESGQHLLTLINDILDITRIEAERLSLAPSEIKLGSFLDGIVGIGRMRAEQKGLDFGFRSEDPLPERVVVDATRLRQVLLNLIGNAVKYTEQGEVLLALAASRTSEGGTCRLRFAVRDTGIGIGAEYLHRIFDPFYQIRADRYGERGAGLGLSISRGIVRAMGGELEVRSEEGRGSEFCFELELGVGGRGWAEESRWVDSVRGYEGRRRTLVVADDREDNRAVMRDLLAPLGFEIVAAADGDEAVAAARSSVPDLVLMDLRMPTMSGAAAARRIRGDPRLALVKIVAVSASVFSEDMAMSALAGCDAFVSKPVKLGALLEAIGSCLGLSWLSGAEPSGAGEASGRAPESTSSGPPPGSTVPDLRELVEAARRGDMDAVAAWADRAEEADPGSAEQAARLRSLASSFRARALLSLAENWLDGRHELKRPTGGTG